MNKKTKQTKNAPDETFPLQKQAIFLKPFTDQLFVCACVSVFPGTRYQSLDRGGLVDVHDREFIPIREPRDRSRDRSLERGLYLGESNKISVCVSMIWSQPIEIGIVPKQ